jgi:pimeloyl-ACP methyl ester carboxylesterase
MSTTTDLVVLHGALGASAQFAPLIASIDPSVRVHALDFEGHASAPPRGRPFRVRHFIEDVVELLDREHILSASFFGYSLGGYVALALALDVPKRVGRVATLGTKFWWDPPTANREVARLDPVTIRAKVPRFAEALGSRHANAGGWERVLAYTAEFLRDLGDHPLLTEETLARITQPVRVVVGDRDATVSVEESAAAARALAAGELCVLPGTPHPIEQVKLERLMPVLTEFFGLAQTTTAGADAIPRTRPSPAPR